MSASSHSITPLRRDSEILPCTVPPSTQPVRNQSRKSQRSRARRFDAGATTFRFSRRIAAPDDWRWNKVDLVTIYGIGDIGLLWACNRSPPSMDIRRVWRTLLVAAVASGWALTDAAGAHLHNCWPFTEKDALLLMQSGLSSYSSPLLVINSTPLLCAEKEVWARLCVDRLS